LFIEGKHGSECSYTTRTTAKEPSVFLFVNPYKSKRDTAGILVKFNPASTSSVTRHKSRHMHLLYDFSEWFIVS